MTTLRRLARATVTSLAVSFVALAALPAHWVGIARAGEKAGEDRIVRPLLPGPLHLANGSVLVPPGLRIVPTLELGDERVTNPADVEAAASSQLGTSSVGANVRANNTAGDAANTTNSENAIAMLGSYGVAGWNDGRNFSITPGASGFATTTDGGLTWIDGGVPPAVSPARYEGDPSLTVDNAGNFYYANLYTPGGAASSLSVNRGTFTGLVFTWNPPVMPVGSTNTDFFDKEWIAADPVGGNVYLTYTRFLSAGGNQIEFARSTSLGAAWDPPVVLTSPAIENVQGSRVAVGPSGEIQVIYIVYDYATANNYMRTRRSTNGGLSFGPEITLPTGSLGIFNNYGSGPAGFNREGGIGFPSLTIDRLGPFCSGRVYATWEETVNFYTDPLGGAGSIAETEANGSSATANPITIGQTVTGAMSSGADQDWFSFSGLAGQTVIFYLTPSSPTPGDGFLRVFAGGGATANRAAFSYLGGGQALCVFTPPSNATYYFRVLDASGASSGNYVVYTGNHVASAQDVGRDQRDVIVQSSSDGVVWDTRRVANDDAPRFDNAWPEVAVDACGLVYIDWMDHRDDATNGILNNVYYASSNNCSATFSAGIKVNDGPAVNWNNVASNLAPNMGDYWNLVGDGANVYASFADGRGGSPDSWFAKINQCQVTATQVSLVSSQADPDRVTLRWYSEDGASLAATVFRRVADGDWGSMGVVHGDADGTIEFVDRSVSAGTSYEYRLGVGDDYYGQVTVSVPAAVTFALHRMGQNPASGDLDVSFSLPSTEPAKLELIDVSGRSLRSVTVGGSSGSDVVCLSRRGTLPAGIYLVRLTQGTRTASLKAIVVKP